MIDLTERTFHSNNGWIIVPSMFIHVALIFVACITLIHPVAAGDPYYSIFRAVFYFGYTIVLIWGARESDIDLPPEYWPFAPLPHFELAELFSVSSLLLYGVAWWLEQEYVFSRVLGGPGVERMALYLTRQEPQYDPIDEDDGQIRLP